MRRKERILNRIEKKQIERRVRLAQPSKATVNGIGLELCSASLSCWLKPRGIYIQTRCLFITTCRSMHLYLNIQLVAD
jgi:hypothetical protein